MATVRSAAMSLGVLVPEAAMIALPSDEDGDIAAEAAAIIRERVKHCDALILGPGMSISPRTAQLVAGLLTEQCPHSTIVIHAAALTSPSQLEPVIPRHQQ